jgi:geranylgeranyl diphosphate synthase type II
MTRFDLPAYLNAKKTFVDDALLTRWLPRVSEDPARLHEAIRYSVEAGGKRVRPVLVFAAAQALEVPERDVLPIAAALEMIHVFSLIHDDLPAMDDDDLRRGKPTNHKVFGEAIAILAGDALHTLAFAALTELDARRYDPHHVLRVIRAIADATGPTGMIGGQVIDMESEGKTIDLTRLKTLHRMKTGALIRVAVEAPGLLAGVGPDVQAGLKRYGEAVGLAFQIADDILDIEGGADLGKDIGSDIANGKATYPALLGMDGAKAAARQALEEALSALAVFGDAAEPLRALARFIVERKN